MARGTWADAVRVREGRRALERRRGDPFVRTKRNSVSASLYTRYSQRVCGAYLSMAKARDPIDYISRPRRGVVPPTPTWTLKVTELRTEAAA
jgi:hypothetical protein